MCALVLKSGFNTTPEWLVAAQNYAASILAKHGFLLLALALAVAYLWPVLQRYRSNLSRHLLAMC